MTFWRRRRPAAQHLYESVLSQSRSPELYGPGRTPDTIDGRFEQLALHMALVVRRLQDEGEGEAGKAAAQALFDAFVGDMDANLREMGASDTRFGKKMRHIVAAFYGRATAYDTALQDGDDAMLAEALERNLLEEGAPADWLNEMVAYCRAAAEKLKSAETERVLAGEDLFPAPPAP